jgi:major membrane immunogen (membrane-anchored lipoprotein)
MVVMKGLVMKRIVLLILMATLLLSACGDDDDSGRSADYGPIRVTDVGRHGSLDAIIVNFNGQEVRCLMYDDYQKGGLSCDWSGR